jgi:hypothetical protein
MKRSRKITVVTPGEAVNPRRWFGTCEYCGCVVMAEPAKTDFESKSAELSVDCPTENCGRDIKCDLVETDESGNRPRHV